MASDRPFPPSARRLALARAAGLTPASPIVVGALACIGAIIALVLAGRAMFARLGASVRGAIEGADGSALAHVSMVGDHNTPGGAADAGAVTTGAAPLDPSDLVASIISLALPVLGAIAIAAVLAHLAQTRALWIPRRRLPNAPVEDPQRGARGAIAITNATVIALVVVVWLFAMAPRLATLTLSPRAGGLSILGFLATLASTWVVLGVVDALVRLAGHVNALRMTPAEQRADLRLAGADPRWRARREKLARGEPARDAIAAASVLLLGDGVAVAVSWDPVRRPVPTRTASGRAARATQLLGLARRHAIAVHRDAELATLLATGDGPVPEAYWTRLAEIIAGVRR